MKRPFSKLLNTILAALLFCIVLASCDNFMTGGNIRKEIEDAIAEANAQKTNILISADDGTGTTIPLGSYEAKLGYSFQLSFSENSKYSFVKWQAVNQDDPSIIITDGVQFEDETQPKTKVAITTKEKIRIMPSFWHCNRIIGHTRPGNSGRKISIYRCLPLWGSGM